MRALAVLLAALTSCSRVNGPIAAPPQGLLFRPARFDRVGHFVSMNRPNATMYFVRDIQPKLEANTWRWTGRNPTLRFHLPVVDDLAFLMDFAIAGATFEQTGPVTLEILVNGRRLAKVRYDEQGEKQFRQPVPASWLSTSGDTTVSIVVDKVWRRANGDELGFILTRAGFVQ